jgi:(heptosyl)LPS beta-1,4-glucosyltransferase
MSEPLLLPLSGVVIARDEGDRIGRCLASLAAICDDLLVLDSGSTDDTVAVARRHGARVEFRAWEGFAAQKNAAIAGARHGWVLLLDADEWLEPDACARIRALFDSGRVDTADVWRLPRRMRFLGRPLRFGGFGAERVERLSRNSLRYLPARVHERPDLAGLRIGRCDARIEHEPVRSLPEYRAKLERYARLWAEQRHADGRRCGPLAPAAHAAASWLKGAVLRLGLLDGRAGWIFHACNLRYVHRKYALLRELAG